MSAKARRGSDEMTRLILAQAEEHNVAHVDPNFLAHLAPDVAQPLDAVHALRF